MSGVKIARTAQLLFARQAWGNLHVMRLNSEGLLQAVSLGYYNIMWTPWGTDAQ